MVQFNRLKLVGFKSFVDPAELYIEDGLTGVVGPNGCGKSNVVEALRWVMGETSAKQMRGRDMSDVIFGGSIDRPARNIAEVTVRLDNSSRTAPAMFNDVDELEVVRRIERGGGSNYKVNGKDVRAKDVQLLFADAATGARSTAMVSQGKIGALISAKPSQRRLILEEAAGITGLHTRRHEAELRLNGAETNLERLDDVLSTLDGQILSLKRQAGQARKYRDFSDAIRRTEATLLHIRWTDANKRRDDARGLLVDGEGKVRELTGLVAEATAKQASIAAKLPDLRRMETEAAAMLQRMIIEREGLDKDRQALESRISALKSQIQQIAADVARESELANDAQGALEKLKRERDDLAAASDGEDDKLDEARAKAERADMRVRELEADLERLTRAAADVEARTRALIQRTNDLQARRERLIERRDEAVARLDDIRVESDFSEQIEEAELAIEEAEEMLEGRQMAVEQAADAIEAAEERARSLRDAESQTEARRRETEAAAAKLDAEISALEGLLKSDSAEDFPKLLDQVTVSPGFEKAVAAALGEDLDASEDPAAPIHWRNMAPVSGDRVLPDGVTSLSDVVQAPDRLARRLAQIGVVDDADTAEILFDDLVQGQRLVTRDGAMWRWDGYQLGVEAPLAAAARFEQRNRLEELYLAYEDAQMAAEEAAGAEEEARHAVEEARNAAEAARNAEREAHLKVREAEGSLNRAREERAHLAREAAATETRIQAGEAAVKQAEQDLEDTAEALVELAEERAELEELGTVQEDLAVARAGLAEARADQMETRTQRERMERDMTGRRKRLEFVERDIASWQERAGGAGDRVNELKERREEASMELEELELQPDELEEKKAVLADRIALAEEKRQEAADALALAETEQRDTDSALKEAESTLAKAREGRVRAEAQLEQADTQLADLVERVRERLNCVPDQLPEVAELDLTQPLPKPLEVDRELVRLTTSRDALGAVNLRAEVELAEMEEQRETLLTEREDLIKAIEKLRSGIGQLNKEARQRLMAAFNVVDGHFRHLFGRLFGGGQAHLALTDSDDPLEAGLDIMASPPGKKLQNLSLLSGGEQALTAVALLFAVFMTNPAPICVLDEVDAPLDDANVDRFCKLLSDIGRKASTRFLVITHHRLTMARMDRLFGVTMAERGVSSLVSVDLHQAEVYAETKQEELFA